MNIPFVKMHGNGNDFVIIDNSNINLTFSNKKILQLGNRNFGIGFDQLILLESSSKYDIFMKIYNCDGVEVEMCGNAARCVASLLFTSNKKNKVKIETISSVLSAQLFKNGQISVDIELPSQDKKYFSLSKEIDIGNIDFSNLHPVLKGGILVNMGNPHIVFIVPSLNAFNLGLFGKNIETNSLFKNKINVEVVEIISDDNIKIHFWERGVGLTLACGSGTLAAVYACYKKKKCSSRVKVALSKEEVTVSINQNILSLIGKAEVSFLGEFFYEQK